MKPITITMTPQTAQALVWALKEYMRTHTPVREYVDKRYASHDEGFRNSKIGEIQDKLNMLFILTNRVQNHITFAQMQAEQKWTQTS